MKLENQVCSLELAKRLKELGVKQESLYYWSLCQGCVKEYGAKGIKVDYELGDSGHGDKWSAFTVAELGEMLPVKFFDKEYDEEMYTVFSKNDDEWITYYVYSEEGGEAYRETDKNEANARAKMLIYLIENKLMEIPQ